MKKLPLAALCITLLHVAACRPSSEPCSEADLAALEGAYVSEALKACEGYSSATCPDLPAIRAEYKARRSEWVRCSGGAR